MNVEPGKDVIGARVSGISLTTVPDADTRLKIEAALEQHGVLIFPEQMISPAQQVAFSKAFAPLELTDLDEARLPGFEEIFVVGNTGKSLVTFAPKDLHGDLEWHTDHIHRDVPARASLLYAKEVPEAGGDTLFACMYSAYAGLSDHNKAEYCKLEILNSVSGLEYYLEEQGFQSEGRSGALGSVKIVKWPLVREHPVTGRRALYFGSKVSIGVTGWPEDKARHFINGLTEYACQPAYQYRHRWSVGDAVLWDNRRVLHAGTPYDTGYSRRHMHRTTWRETESIDLIG